MDIAASHKSRANWDESSEHVRKIVDVHVPLMDGIARHIRSGSFPRSWVRLPIAVDNMKKGVFLHVHMMVQIFGLGTRETGYRRCE